MASFLDKEDADIIALQEVEDGNPKFDIIKHLKNAGYKYTYASTMHSKKKGKPFTFGPAIFSKYEIAGSRAYPLSQKANGSAVRTDIKVGERVLHVFSTHLLHTHQKESAEQQGQAKKLIGLAPKERTIVMGDFNALPDSKVISSIKEYYNDTDANSNPTWSMYRLGCPRCLVGNVKHKLDYIFTSKDIKTDSFKVGESKGSDHLPISVNIEI